MSTYSLPQTMNTLGPRQRARLIQSSRKLEAILGVTPQLLHLDESQDSFRRPSFESSVSSFESSDSLLPPAPPPKRSRGMTLKLVVGGSSSSSSSSKALPKTPKSTKRMGAPPPLILQYHQSLGSGYDPRASIISTIGSEQQAAVPPRSPLSPRYHPSTDYRRKRMAKLARTLGENVPPELVFPGLAADSQAAADRKQLRAERGRSWSVGSSNPMPLRKPSAVKPSFEIEGRPRKDSLAFQNYVGIPERSVSRAETLRSTYSQLTRSESPFSQHSVESVNTRRKEREWSGEWNAPDMDNVIKSLRDLKAK